MSNAPVSDGIVAIAAAPASDAVPVIAAAPASDASRVVAAAPASDAKVLVAAASASDAAHVIAAAPIIRGRGPWELAFERLRRDHAAIAAALTIVAALVIALAAPLLAYVTGHPPTEQFTATGLSPSGIPVGPGHEFWLGTDALGRDVLVRIAYGTRISLLVGVLASALAVLIGAIVGIIAGWHGGAIDTFLSRFMDVVLIALPGVGPSARGARRTRSRREHFSHCVLQLGFGRPHRSRRGARDS